VRVDSCIIVRSLTHLRVGVLNLMLATHGSISTCPRHCHRLRCHARRILVRGPFCHEPSQRPTPSRGRVQGRVVLLTPAARLWASASLPQAPGRTGGSAAGLAEVTAADLLADHWFSNSLERAAPAAPTRSHPRRLQTRPQPQGRPPLFPKTRSAPGSWWLAVRRANATIMVIRTHYSGRKGITRGRPPL